MDIILILAQAFWFMLPAYVANPTAVVCGGGRPVDAGRVLRDGRRLLGDGKTWRGLAGGILSGAVLGVVLHSVAVIVESDSFSFGSLFQAAALVFLLPFGALMGDILGSFIKRRMGLERGARSPGLDQYDFLIGTVVFLLAFETQWFLEHYVLGYAVIGLIFVIVITPPIHRAVNIIGHRLGKKDVPW